MKANIRFYLPKKALNPEVNKEKGREELVDFQCDVDAVGVYCFSDVLAAMGGGVYTYRDMSKTPKDNEVERLWQTVERGIESTGSVYDDDDSEVDDALDALQQLQKIFR